MSLDLADPRTGEVLFRLEPRARHRTPGWIVIFKAKQMELTEKLKMQELAVLSYLVVQMRWGNMVPLGAFDVARRFGLTKRSAQRYLAGLVKVGAIQKLNTNCYRVSIEVAWLGSLKEWHKLKAEQAQA